MLNEIGIIYSCSQAGTGAFWYYFFQMCGVWCEKHIIDSSVDWQEFSNFSRTVNLVITDDKGKEEAFKTELVIKSDGIKICYCRNFLLDDKSDFEIIKNAKKVIRKMFCSMEEEGYACETLVEIYFKYNLRYNIWAYQELLWNEQSEIIAILNKNLKMALSKIESLDVSIYRNYATIYLKYILLQIYNDKYVRNDKLSQDLLRKCKEIIDTDPTYFTVYLLAGKICKLSSGDEKFSLMYDKTALKYFDGSWLLYYVGRASEQKEQHEEAYSYYDQAYALDKSNYCALFKLAWRNEQSGINNRAVDEYNQVLKILSSRSEKMFTDVLEVEYACKAWMRLGIVMGRKLNLSTMEKICKKNIKDIEDKFIKKSYFSAMCHGIEWKEEQFVNNIKMKIRSMVEMQLGHEMLISREGELKWR